MGTSAIDGVACRFEVPLASPDPRVFVIYGPFAEPVVLAAKHVEEDALYCPAVFPRFGRGISNSLTRSPVRLATSGGLLLLKAAISGSGAAEEWLTKDAAEQVDRE